MEKKYFRRLDYIRVISCIMVLLYHLNILKGGFLAVCTFFTLSGYLGCMSALKNNNFSIKNYYINRLKKIYIPLIIVVFITIIAIKINPSIKFINLKSETTSVIFGYNNFWQLSANLDYFTRHVNSPFMHLWYISILMQFELIFPIIFVVLKKINKKINKNISTIVIFILMILSTLYFYYLSKNKDIMIVYYNTFARIYSIIFGIFLALINHKYNLKLSNTLKKFSKIIFILYTFILIILTIFISSKTKNYAIYMIITTIISARLIEYATVEGGFHERPNKLISLISKCSYEIYLVQYPVIFFMQNLDISKYIKVPVIIIITFTISYILNKILSTKLKMYKYIKDIFVCMIIIIGSIILITEKDHKAEMKELENKLNENSKMIEKKNNDYLNALNNEQQQWNEILENMENEEAAIAEAVRKLPIVGVGDSVLLGTIDELYEKFPNGYFDGKVSRSIKGAEDLLISLKNEGKLANTLILALANNGDYSDKINKELMDIVGDREVYWINAVNADDPKFNERFKEFASNYSNIHIVDWQEASKNHPEYFYADGIHLKGEGPKAYANTVFDAICADYSKDYKNKKDKLLNNHEKELKSKIAFYGNNVLINSFSYIDKKFKKAVFNTKQKYDFTSLYNDIKEKIDNNNLEYRVVLLFDNDINISSSEYQKLIDLCKGHEIYICNMTNQKLEFTNDNVKIINFYEKIKKNSDYMLDDKKTLSKKGNTALANMLDNKINKK